MTSVSNSCCKILYYCSLCTSLGLGGSVSWIDFITPIPLPCFSRKRERGRGRKTTHSRWIILAQNPFIIIFRGLGSCKTPQSVDDWVLEENEEFSWWNQIGKLGNIWRINSLRVFSAWCGFSHGFSLTTDWYFTFYPPIPQPRIYAKSTPLSPILRRVWGVWGASLTQKFQAFPTTPKKNFDVASSKAFFPNIPPLLYRRQWNL